MTILSSQLLTLRREATSALDVDKRKRPSILFEPGEAMKMTPEVVLELARTGVNSLSLVDSRINAFKETLFGEDSISLERNMLTPSDNDKLSEKIRACLAVICPHMLLRPAHKCLEWLLMKYHIAEIQAGDLLFTLLPYHDTNLFTKMSVQIRLPVEWRWLKSFKKEPPARHIVLRELRANPGFLSKFAAFVSQAAEDESNPLNMFATAATNMIVAEGAKPAVLSVIVSQCLSSLQSSINSQRAFGLATVANICAQSTTDQKLDAQLAKKILKYILPSDENDEMAQEALLVAGSVYERSERIDQLPNKFISRVTSLVTARPELLTSSSPTKLHSACLDRAIIAALSGEEGPYGDYVAVLLGSGIDLDVSAALDIAMGDLTNPAAAAVLSYVQVRSPQVLALKLESSREAVQLSKLPPEVLLHHQDEKVRLGAMEELKSKFTQETLARVARGESSKAVIAKCLELIDAGDLTLRSELYQKHDLGAKELIDSMSATGSAKTVAILFDSENQADVLSKLGLDSILSHPELDSILDIMISDRLDKGLKAVAASLATKNSPVALRLLSVGSLEVAHEVARAAHLDDEAKTKLATMSFHHPKLMGDFVKFQLKGSRKETAEYFGRFALLNPGHISGAITMLTMSLVQGADQRLFQIAAFHALQSEDELTRKMGLEVLQLMKPNPVSEKVLKRSHEIKSDPIQVGQVLDKVLRKQGFEKWGKVSKNLNDAPDFELVALFDLVKPERVANVALSQLSNRLIAVSSGAALLGHLCAMLGRAESKVIDSAMPNVESLLGQLNDETGPKVVASLLSSAWDVSQSGFVEKIIVQAQTYATKSLLVSQAVSTFVSEASSELLSALLSPGDKEESNGSVIKAKRRRLSKPSLKQTKQLSFFVFLLEKSASKSLEGLSEALNQLLEFALKSEGAEEEKIQSLIIGLAAGSELLKPENLVEVVRRCSVCGSEDTRLNLTLIGALGLLSHLAKTVPDQVLNSLMSVFTFMGRGLLPRADDRYSFHAIQETIKCVVPPLLKENKFKIVDIFAAATPHVPVHRRETVFQSLMATCGVSETLWLGWFKLAVHHVRAVETGSNLQDPTDFSELMTKLISRFTVREVIDSTVAMAKHLSQMPFNPTKEQLIADQVLDPQMTPEEVVNLHFVVNYFLSSLYSSHDFLHGQLARITDEEESNLNDSYGGLLEYMLAYTGRIQSDKDRRTAIQAKAFGVVERVSALLPPIEFSQIICGLISNGVKSKREWLVMQSLEMLCSRLRTKKEENGEADAILMETILEELVVVLKSVDSVQPLNLAMKAIKLITKSTPTLAENAKGAKHMGLMLARMKVMLASGSIPIRAKDSVYGSLILTAGVLVAELKIKALPHLTWVMEALLSGLASDPPGEQLKLILLASLSKVIAAQRQFLSPFLQKTVLVLCKVDVGTAPELVSRLSKAVELISKSPSRLLLPALSATYAQQLDGRQTQQLLVITERHIENVDKNETQKQQDALQKFFVEALDFRTSRGAELSPEVVTATEKATCSALVKLSLKLPEASLRPLLFKIFSWATLAGSKPTRLLSLYNLYVTLATTLKSMFPLFIGSLDRHLIDLLPKLTNAEEPMFDSSRDLYEILANVLQVLKSILLYDQGDFLTEQVAQDLVPLMIDLLDMTRLSEYESFCDSYLVPAIAQASAAISDDTVWRPLNYRILLKLRHDEPQVRIAGLKAIEACVAKLGDSYQNLLHESAPFLAELLEDDCPEVEAKIRSTIRFLEDTFKDEISSYF